MYVLRILRIWPFSMVPPLERVWIGMEGAPLPRADDRWMDTAGYVDPVGQHPHLTTLGTADIHEELGITYTGAPLNATFERGPMALGSAPVILAFTRRKPLECIGSSHRMSVLRLIIPCKSPISNQLPTGPRGLRPS